VLQADRYQTAVASSHLVTLLDLGRETGNLAGRIRSPGKDAGLAMVHSRCQARSEAAELANRSLAGRRIEVVVGSKDMDSGPCREEGTVVGLHFVEDLGSMAEGSMYLVLEEADLGSKTEMAVEEEDLDSTALVEEARPVAAASEKATDLEADLAGE
jgi:hypothetical protein